MRIVIAGSSGLVGSALVPELREAGHEVVRLVRRAPTAADERNWDPPAGRLDLDTADAVVNLCGAGVGDRRWSAARKQLLVDSRLEPTEVLATAVAERGIPVLVNASGVHYYGDAGERILDEDSPKGQGFLSDLCRDWEAATARASAAGARVVLARTSHVLSESGGLLGPLRLLVRFGLGGRLGRGDQYMPWIHLADHVAAIRFLIENEISGPVNLASPHPVTNAELTRALGRSLHRPTPWKVPKFALQVVLGDFAEEMLMSQRAISTVLPGNGFTFRHTKLDGALAAL
jgi:uncharacterized protein (TIGR01777 family)